jgi:RimJ/RimL family protein N-acetyltransferase
LYVLSPVDAADSRLIGGCDLTLENSHEADLGYILARRAWGNGYGTEIARALVERGFSDLGLHRIFATCDRENHASRRVLEKAGLLFESTLIRHKFAKSRWWNSELYALTRKHWSAAADGDDGGPSPGATQ